LILWCERRRHNISGMVSDGGPFDPYADPLPCPIVTHNNRQLATGVQRVSLLASAVVLCSCAPPLLSPDEPRSQFDRYDGVRNQRAEQSIFDDFGVKRPNLEQRLSPRE
jgi:hypothetical protein